MKTRAEIEEKMDELLKISDKLVIDSEDKSEDIRNSEYAKSLKINSKINVLEWVIGSNNLDIYN